MASTKSFIKGLAAGAVLGAVAAIVTSLENKDEKIIELQKAASRIKDKVAKHARTMGKLSKSAYHEIVDKTVEEYRGLKHLSDKELNELKAELKDSWSDVEKVVKGKKPTPPPTAPKAK
jgi:gas vesicle protein